MTLQAAHGDNALLPALQRAVESAAGVPMSLIPVVTSLVVDRVEGGDQIELSGSVDSGGVPLLEMGVAQQHAFGLGDPGGDARVGMSNPVSRLAGRPRPSA